MTKESFPPNLKLLLENDDIVFAGRQVNGDCNRLRKLGVRIKQSLELRALALKHDPSISLKGGTSLCNLCKIYLKMNLLKTHQLADYSTLNLSPEIIEYEALDELVSRKVCSKILNVMQASNPTEGMEESEIIKK